MQLQRNSLIMMIGPTGSGKSYFAKEYLIKKLREQDPDANIQYISSDELRRIVVGKDLHKHHPDMMYASESAFALLYARVDAAMNWPTNADFIVVDTTGLSEEFRSNIVTRANNSNYRKVAILFDFKNRQEYRRYNENDPDFDSRVMFNHIERMRKDVWPNISKNGFDQIIKITNKDFEQFPVVIKNTPKYKFDINLADVNVIGDVHGCYDELKELLDRLGYTFDDEDRLTGNYTKKVIFVGDLIDKGPKSKKVMDLVLKNESMFMWVLGNHENFVYKWLSGMINDIDMTNEFRQTYFSCTEEFKNDPEAIDMVKRLYTGALPFVVLKDAVITHAPCRNKYLGKTDRTSLKEQNRPRLGDKSTNAEELEKQLSFLEADAINNAPRHIFGHISSKSTIWVKNKLGIDTGCQAGGRLTSVTKSRGKIQFTSVESRQPKTEELPELFRRKKSVEDFNLDNLDPRELRRIKWLVANKVNFISGTMAPSAADIENNELESLKKGLDYFKEHGVKELHVQPKFMGSRCNLYSFLDPTKSFAVSRNGFKIRHVDLMPIFEKFSKIQREEMPKPELIVYDGELLPWSVLGKGLIEENYKVIEHGIKSEIELLLENNFEIALSDLFLSSKETGDMDVVCNLPKKEAIEKIGQNKYGTLISLKDYKHNPIAKQIEMFNTYSEQISLFGQSGEPFFRPFAILKSINNVGEMCAHQLDNYTNKDQYDLLAKILGDKDADVGLTVDLTEPDAYEKAQEYFDKITKNQKMEGVVLKPNLVKRSDVAPYMKVRNPRYLTLVYGYDYTFPPKYERLLRSKRIGRKIGASVSEWNLGLSMLEVKQEEITESNFTFMKLAANMIAEEKRERDIDPRL